MNGKIVAGLIAALLIVSVAIFAGCVEKETSTEDGESTPTPYPGQTLSPTTEPVLASGYVWYHSEEFGYKIAYPENWEKNVVISTDGGDDGVIFSDPDTGTSNVMVATMSEYDIDALKAETEGGEEVIINGRSGYAAILQPMSMLKMRLVVFDVGDRYYLIYCTAPVEPLDGSMSTFDDTVDTFDNVINSFVIE